MKILDDMSTDVTAIKEACKLEYSKLEPNGELQPHGPAGRLRHPLDIRMRHIADEIAFTEHLRRLNLECDRLLEELDGTAEQIQKDLEESKEIAAVIFAQARQKEAKILAARTLIQGENGSSELRRQQDALLQHVAHKQEGLIGELTATISKNKVQEHLVHGEEAEEMQYLHQELADVTWTAHHLLRVSRLSVPYGHPADSYARWRCEIKQKSLPLLRNPLRLHALPRNRHLSWQDLCH